MVYALKFDYKHDSGVTKKDVEVRSTSAGDLVVEGKVIHVFEEKEPDKIPWEISGVDYVVETAESLCQVQVCKVSIGCCKKAFPFT